MFKYSKAFSSFSVNDLRRAKDFYQNLLNLEIAEDETMDMLELRINGGCTVMVYAKSDHEPASFTVLNFPVDNIESAVEKLSSLGVKFEKYSGELETDEKGIYRGEGHSIAWFKDPAGNILSVLQEEKSKFSKVVKESQKVTR